jgi:hypothetical protein
MARLGRWHCHDGRVSTIVLWSLLFAGPTSVGKTVEGAVRCERVQLPSELGQQMTISL